jgi:two-component system sensor histidine kinase GlrK
MALGNAGVTTGRLAHRSSQAVERASHAASESRLLVNQVLSLERKARQFLVLWEAQLLEEYADRRKTFHQTIERLQMLLDHSEQNARLDLMLTLEEEAQRALETMPYQVEVDRGVLDRFQRLHQLAWQGMDESHRLSLAEANAMQREAESAQHALLWMASALVPVTVVISALFAWLLSKPIRRIDEGIRRLGTGDFSSAIAVRGPRDLEFLGERLDWLRRRLADLEAEKAKFLAHVSHELKTPLTAIREGGDILSEGVFGPFTGEQREVATIVRDNSIRLQHLIENLLRFSIDRAKGPVESVVRVDLAVILKEILADHRPGMLAKQIDLVAEIESGWVEAERGRLRTVLDNLVSNAIRFTPKKGAVRISLNTRGEETVLEVCDTGPGIRPEERDQVFEPFFQGSASGPESPKGTGLGLSIVAEYVEDFGGKITVGEETGGGASLRVGFPCAECQANS